MAKSIATRAAIWVPDRACPDTMRPALLRRETEPQRAAGALRAGG